MNPLINRLFGVEYMVKPDLWRGELPSNREAYRTELKIASPVADGLRSVYKQNRKKAVP